jgi:hypothetical protein
MSPETSSTRARLDHVEAGLDAIEAALARLDAGDVDGDLPAPVGEDVSGPADAGVSAEPDADE